MSQIFKKSYTGFQRGILGEIMTPEELKELDKRYNKAKRIRMSRRTAAKLTKERIEQIKQMRADLKVVLANDVCSAQALDVIYDRNRVEKEIVKMLTQKYTWQTIASISSQSKAKRKSSLSSKTK